MMEIFPIINLIIIFKDNKKVIKDNTNNFTYYFLFFILPSLFSVFCIYIRKDFFRLNIGLIITILSILEGFLFNALILMINIFTEIKPNNKRDELKSSIIKETKINLLYEIIIILIELILILFLYLIPNSKNTIYLNYFLSFFIFYFFVKIFFMLLSILKKLYGLIVY